MNRMLRLVALSSLLSLSLVACGPSDAEQRKAAVEQYARVGSSLYTQSLNSAKAMQASIAAFVAAPSESTMTAARDGWKTARMSYEKTEGMRLYGGPIDNLAGGLPEANMNPWPLDETYIDYGLNPDTGMLDMTYGIINDTSIALTKDGLRNANGATGETNLTIGWHAIEFLLWGQDLSTTGPGARPATDYTRLANADRRAQYLTLTTDILLEDLESVQVQWKLDDATSYGAKMIASSDPSAKLTLALKGLGNFLAGELNRERINNAYATKDQEEEHSCFSDTTVPIDLNNSVLGVKMILTGDLDGTTGPSVQSLIDAKNATIGAKLKADTDAALAAVNAIPAPFDQAILGADTAPGRTAILASVNANKKLALTLAEVANELGLSLDFDYCPEGKTSCRPQ